MTVAEMRGHIMQLQESFADLARANEILAADNLGWKALNETEWDDFTTDQRRRANRLGRLMATANPLIKSAIGIRIGYIWGQGVEIRVDDSPDSGQDINAIVQEFLDNDDTIASWSSMQAREEQERALATDGEVMWCCRTNRATGKVRIAELDPDEITDIITDPDDHRRPLYYRREYTPHQIGPDGTSKKGAPMVRFYPALGYRPAHQLPSIAGHDVMWDEPVLHVAVNRPRRSLRGIGDAYPALSWAALYKRFLEDWATLIRALSRIAWQVTTRGDKAASAAARIQAMPDVAGQTIVSSPDVHMQAAAPRGATIDSESGRPIASMVAAGMGIPVTMLMGDPGATGARAVAETLDVPTENGLRVRRELWRSAITAVISHVIDVAIESGKLRGTVTRDADRVRASLPDEDGRTVVVDFPEFDDDNTLEMLKALQIVDQTGYADPASMLSLMFQALKVRDVDELVGLVTDDQGRLIPPDVRDDQARQAAADRG